MARVNIEDDLWTSGRLAKLARSSKLDEDTALGRLVNVYRLTQRAGIIAEKPERIATVIVIGFATDHDAELFLDAMVSAQLATYLDNGHLLIRGNDKHVERLSNLKQSAANGGKTTQQKKRNDSQSDSLADAKAQGEQGQSAGQATAKHSGTLPTPSSPLLAFASNEAREIARAQKTQEGDDPNLLSSHQVQMIPIEEARHVHDAWTDELAKHRKIDMPPIPSPKDIHHFRHLVLRAGNRDVAAKIARAWVHCDDAKGYFKRQGWAPWLLLEDRNFAEARAKAATLMKRTQAS